MAKTEFLVPAMGEGIIEVTITRWFVKEGDWVEEETPLVEVATDKVDSEVPSPVSGKIARILYQEGDMPRVGEVLALIIGEGDDEVEESTLEEGIEKQSGTRTVKPEVVHLEYAPDYSADAINISPFIRFLARDRGISKHELQLLQQQHKDGKVTRDDLNNYLYAGRPYRHSEAALIPGMEPNDSKWHAYQPREGDRVVAMDRTRKLIARHTVHSKRIAPHVTSNVEVDVTALVNWRDKHKEYPGINISVVGESIVFKKDINIGVATALPDGNLIVPVIHQADTYNWKSLASQVADLTSRARKGNLLGHEVQGGSFTVTNMGQFNNISGTPIINQPEAAILAVGAIQKKPGVVWVAGQPAVGVRDMVVLSLTYDHRAIDGALGGSFLNAVGVYLEKITGELSVPINDVHKY